MPSPLKNLFKPDKTPLFPFIDGLRALSILWIISLHTLWMFGYFLDRQTFIELSTRAELSPFFQGHLAVDIFFVLSGFLIGYYLFREYQQSMTYIASAVGVHASLQPRHNTFTVSKAPAISKSSADFYPLLLPYIVQYRLV